MATWIAKIPRWAIRSAEGVLAIGAAVLVLYQLRVSLATGGFLLLPIVLLVAMRGGFWAATWASVFAIVCLDFWFIPPLFHFSIDEPQNWLSLFAFQISAMVVSRLSSRLSIQTAVAVRGRQELAQLYELSRGLLLLNDDEPASTQITLALKDAFNATAVAIYDSQSNKTWAVGKGDPLLESEVRAACLLNEDIGSSSPDTLVRVLHRGSRVLGSIGMRGVYMTKATADAALNLVAVALEDSKHAGRHQERDTVHRMKWRMR